MPTLSLRRSTTEGESLEDSSTFERVAVPRIRQRRRPAVVALAVALIAVGGLGAYAWAKQGATTVAVVVIQRDVRAGRPLVSDDLGVIDIGSVQGLAVVPADQREGLLGKYVRSDLPKGSLVNPAQTTASLTPRAGTAVVGILAKAGQMPSTGLRAGDGVRVVMGYASGANAASTAVKPGTAWSGVVATVSETRDSGTRVVDVALSSTEAEAVAALCGTGLLSIVAGPAGS